MMQKHSQPISPQPQLSNQSPITNKELKNNTSDMLNSTSNNSLKYSNLIRSIQQNQNNKQYGNNYQHHQILCYQCHICNGLRQVCPKNQSKQFWKFCKTGTKDNLKIGGKQCDGVMNQYQGKEQDMDMRKKSQFNPLYDQNTIPPQQSSMTHNNTNIIWNQTPSFGPQAPISHQNTSQNFKIPKNSHSTSTTINPQSIPAFTNSSSQIPVHHNSYSHLPPPTNPYYPQHQTIIQQIIYIPIIHNIIKPQFINPQHSDTSFPQSQKLSDNQYKSLKQKYPILQDDTSPIKKYRINQKDILTPEGIRKLAQSLIR